MEGGHLPRLLIGGKVAGVAAGRARAAGIPVS
jgi:hypothetical protein